MKNAQIYTSLQDAKPVVPIIATTARMKINYYNGRCVMRKFLLYSSALVLGFSGVAETACIQTPNCSSLGYSSTTACEGGLTCPWGNAWFCNVGGGSSTPDYSDCEIGDILYSDMSCNANIVASKTPIGVVFDTTNKLAIALTYSAEKWSEKSFDIPDLENINSSLVGLGDWQGKNNTKIILEYCSKSGYSCPAAEYANNYTTSGTVAGDWYLPAIGEVNAIYVYNEILSSTLAKVGGSMLDGESFASRHWSSSEHSAEASWAQDVITGNFITQDKIYGDGFGNKGYYRVRPVINYGEHK